MLKYRKYSFQSQGRILVLLLPCSIQTYMINNLLEAGFQKTEKLLEKLNYF